MAHSWRSILQSQGAASSLPQTFPEQAASALPEDHSQCAANCADLTALWGLKPSQLRTALCLVWSTSLCGDHLSPGPGILGKSLGQLLWVKARYLRVSRKAVSLCLSPRTLTNSPGQLCALALLTYHCSTMFPTMLEGHPAAVLKGRTESGERSAFARSEPMKGQGRIRAQSSVPFLLRFSDGEVGPGVGDPVGSAPASTRACDFSMCLPPR